MIAVGPGGRNEDGEIVPLDVKAGDRVLFGKWSGTEVKIDGEDLLIMKESDLLGIIEQEAQPQLSGDGRQWLLKKSSCGPTPGSGCCTASTFSPTR